MSSQTRKVYFEIGRFEETPVYEMNKIPSLCEISGPALLIDETTSILVEPNCVAHLTEEKNVWIEISNQNTDKNLSEKSDPISLAIFSHRSDTSKFKKRI